MEKLITPEEAARLLAVSPRTVKDWLRRGNLNGVKAGNLWRIRESDLERFLKKDQRLKNSNLRSGVEEYDL